MRAEKLKPEILNVTLLKGFFDIILSITPIAASKLSSFKSRNGKRQS